jgi:hypothetical protein
MGRRMNLRLAQPKRRLTKDFEASIASAKAWVYIASLQLLIRRLAYPQHSLIRLRFGHQKA